GGGGEAAGGPALGGPGALVVAVAGGGVQLDVAAGGDVAAPGHHAVDPGEQGTSDGQLGPGEEDEVGLQAGIAPGQHVAAQLGVGAGGVLDAGDHALRGQRDQVVARQRRAIDPGRDLVGVDRDVADGGVCQAGGPPALLR